MDLTSAPVFGGIVLLSLGAVLAAVGLGFIVYSARMTRQAVSRRVELVRGKAARATDREPAEGVAFVRNEAHGQAALIARQAARSFARLGVPAAYAPKALLALRAIFIIALGAATYVLAGRSTLLTGTGYLRPLLSGALGLMGWFVPQLWFERQVKHRVKAVVAGLPDALELLVICVEAGLSFEDGVDRIMVVLRSSQPALADELALTSADLKILPSREEALQNLADRVDAPSIRSVVTTLSQTMRYGTPMAQALRVVGAELRNESLVRLEERANQLPSLMTVPMMLFIMPTIFLIVGGPAVLKLLDTFYK